MNGRLALVPLGLWLGCALPPPAAEAPPDDGGAAVRLDAGPSAETRDAGPDEADAGPRDAGRDASPSDAGRADASPGDAGGVDAGRTDAAPSDAAPSDAGRADASPRDAGWPDLGVDAAIPVGVPVILLDEITGATDDEIPMIHEGVRLANRAMATECFREFVLGASWTETNGLTQAEIYDLLASTPVTVDVDMFTGTWYQNHISRTVGYEDEPGVVHMNRYFVDTAEAVASNIMHEAEGHSQGFSHYGVKATSVPYGLNDAFDACHGAP